MQPLETNQRTLTWLYAFPSNEGATKWEKISYFMVTASVIVAHFCAMISGGFFIAKFVSIDLEVAIYSLFHTIAFSNMFYKSIITVLLRHKLQGIFKSLSKIYNESKINILTFYCDFILLPLNCLQKYI